MTRASFIKILFLAPVVAVLGKKVQESPVYEAVNRRFAGFINVRPGHTWPTCTAYTSGTPVWFVNSLKDIEEGRVYDMETVFECEFTSET